MPIWLSSNNTLTLPLLSWLFMLGGRSVLSNSGSPVRGSDWMSIEPMGTSRMTRRRPCEKGPPERRMDMPTTSWSSASYGPFAGLNCWAGEDEC